MKELVLSWQVRKAPRPPLHLERQTIPFCSALDDTEPFAVGENQHHRWKVGDRAGIKWVWSTCGTCEFCTNGVDELHCPNQRNSGFSAAGTFQEYAISDGRYTTRIPEGVSDEAAGPIMCGGVTAYTAWYVISLTENTLVLSVSDV
jgi:D-arabinose 1-dehydrogenase-like Zn-dependent alcohol dehydrogenase